MYPPQGVVAGVDVSDADAAVGDVEAGKTFYSVAAPRKTGTFVMTSSQVGYVSGAKCTATETWQTMLEVTVLASAKRVFMAGDYIADNVGSGTPERHQQKGTYNGVQRWLKNVEVAAGQFLVYLNRWWGVGVGTDATALVEAW